MTPSTPKSIVCICLAGLGSRFTEKGYTTPKYLLPMRNGETIIGEILSAFEDTESTAFLLILNNRNKDWHSGIETLIENFPHPLHHTYIDDTIGQAETALIGAKMVKETFGEDAYNNVPIIFHNGDTVLYKRSIQEVANQLHNADGLIDTFPANSAAYSYVTVDAQNRVEKMAEKVVISERASTGLYGFSSAQLYADFYDQANFEGEFYISNVYNAMLDKNASIFNYHTTHAEDTLILGTPAEYEAYLHA